MVCPSSHPAHIYMIAFWTLTNQSAFAAVCSAHGCMTAVRNNFFPEISVLLSVPEKICPVGNIGFHVMTHFTTITIYGHNCQPQLWL